MTSTEPEDLSSARLRAHALTAVGFVVMGLIFLIFALRDERERDTLAARGVRDTAYVIARTEPVGRGVDTLHVFFITEGLESHRADINPGRGHDIPKSTRKLDIVYDPRDPTTARDAHGATRHAWELFGLAAAPFALGMWPLYRLANGLRRRRSLPRPTRS